jgi:hypothetical protein
MKVRYIFAIAALLLAPQLKSQGLKGEYFIEVSGSEIVLKLENPGQGMVRGDMTDLEGATYSLEGETADNQSVAGVLTMESGESMYFQAALTGNNLDFYLIPVGFNNQPDYLNASQFIFTRRSGATSGSQQSASNLPKGLQGGMQSGASASQSGQSGPYGQSGQSASRQSVAPDPNVERDERIIGGWRYTNSYVSGEFGAVSETYMQIFADGTYRYGDSQGAGGDARTSFGSGGGGASTGQWKTKDKVVYINEGYGWEPYANYIVDPTSMLFKFDDGSKQLWERYR